MNFFNRSTAKIDEKQPTAPAQPNEHLSNVIEMNASDASVGDTRFTLPFLSGLYNLGRDCAIKAGITTVTDEFLRPLQEHARGIAREYARAKFDPEKHLHDRMEFDEYQRNLKLREDARLGEDHSVARLRESQAILDSTKRVGERPERPTILLILAMAMIAVSLSATAHDRLMPASMDPLLSMVLSILIGGLLAAAPVYAIFHGRSSRTRWIGIIIGAMLAVGLFAVRVAGAESASEYLYSAGWSVVEIVGVLLAEHFSQAHRKTEEIWEEGHHQEVAALAAVASANDDVARWRNRMSAAQRELDRVTDIVTDRNSRALRVGDIEQFAVNTITDGVNAGALHNRGVILGITAPVRAQIIPVKEAK